MKRWMLMGWLFAAALTGARGQSGIDNNFGLPKLGPKPPTTGTLTVTPTAVTPVGATPATTTPAQLPLPGEWKTTSNTIASVEFVAPLPANDTAIAPQWEKKTSGVTAPPLTLALPRPTSVLTSTTNTVWQQTQKPSPLTAPPPSPWDRPGKDAWK
jgi:hypothetical protein